MALWTASGQIDFKSSILVGWRMNKVVSQLRNQGSCLKSLDCMDIRGYVTVF